MLSVIIVTYNSRADIQGCLATLPAELGADPVEVIVVDNASLDGTPELIAAKFPHVQVVPARANLGFGRANNLGFRSARGEYLLFLNPDTILNPAALEHCLARLRAEPRLGIISPRLVQASGEMDLACRRSIPTAWDGFTRATGLAGLFPRVKLFTGYNLTYLPEEGTYPVGSVNGAFLMMPAKVFAELGCFDERFFMYGEDLDLCLRCRRAGYEVIYDGRHSVIHLKGRSSSQEFKIMSKALFTGTKQFYLKNFNPRGSLLTRWKYEFLFWLWYRFSSAMAAVRRRKVARPV